MFWRNPLNRISIFIAIILIALGAATQAASFARQQRQKKPAPRVRPRPTATPAPDMRAEAAEVAIQIKNVSNFLYIYGKVVNGLQVAEEQMKNNQASPEVKARNKESKDRLIGSM